jgi:endonuclease III
MTAVSRTAQFAKLHKVLKKYYKPALAGSARTVVEHMLFACCLEDAHYDAAEEAFAALVHTFFDWNEVRVTSISELSEVMACLPDPRAAANRVKRVLHAVFEATFSFDLEDRRKKNLGPTVKWLEKLDGMTPFTVAYVIQAALEGHAIPVDAGTMGALKVLDFVTDKDAETGEVPGLERAVAKSKGVEFGALLHEFGTDFSANPYSASIREILLQVNPECESRLPKRRVERPVKPAEPAAPSAKPAKETKPRSAAPVDATEAKPAAGKTGTRKKPATAEPAPEPAAAEPVKRKPAPPAEEPATGEKLAPKSVAPKKHPASESLSKRKPR